MFVALSVRHAKSGRHIVICGFSSCTIFLRIISLPLRFFDEKVTYKYVSIFSTIQINQPTRCNNLSSSLLDVYVQLNMFRASSAHRQELNNCSSILWFYRWSVVIAVLLVVVGPTGRPDHDHAPTVKPEAATAVVELLTMDVRTPETYWAVHKRQVLEGVIPLETFPLMEWH